MEVLHGAETNLKLGSIIYANLLWDLVEFITHIRIYCPKLRKKIVRALNAVIFANLKFTSPLIRVRNIFCPPSLNNCMYMICVSFKKGIVTRGTLHKLYQKEIFHTILKDPFWPVRHRQWEKKNKEQMLSFPSLSTAVTKKLRPTLCYCILPHFSYCHCEPTHYPLKLSHWLINSSKIYTNYWCNQL